MYKLIRFCADFRDARFRGWRSSVVHDPAWGGKNFHYFSVVVVSLSEEDHD